MNYEPITFFDLSSFHHKAIFEGIKQTWEVLPEIETYIARLFSSGVLTSNYGSEGNVYIGEGTTIEDAAKIKGPAIIGKHCFIGHAAFLRGGVILGDNVSIGHATELKHVIIMNHTAAAHLNYVGDSVVGNNVNISGGAVFANLRLDHKEVTIRTDEGKVSTGLLKMGSIIGDGSNIGVNCVLNPGTILGKGVLVYPLKEVRGVHLPNESIK